MLVHHICMPMVTFGPAHCFRLPLQVHKQPYSHEHSSPGLGFAFSWKLTSSAFVSLRYDNRPLPNSAALADKHRQDALDVFCKAVKCWPKHGLAGRTQGEGVRE